MLLKLIHKQKGTEGFLPSTVNKASVTTIPNQRMATKGYRLNSLVNTDTRFLNKILTVIKHDP